MIRNFPIVSIGGSAGGTESYVKILKHLAVDTGVAVVIVNHITLTPTNLHKFLSRYTAMPVELVTAGLRIKPNHVFVILPTVTCMFLMERFACNRDQSLTDGQM